MPLITNADSANEIIPDIYHMLLFKPEDRIHLACPQSSHLNNGFILNRGINFKDAM